MGPYIILDKSSLQSFSNSEIAILHKYYFINVTPVLIMEILADLKKENIREKDFAAVQLLASKILNMDMTINAHCLHMLHNSLRGYEPVLDGRPNRPGGRQVVADDGRKGVVFKESEEEAALNRWKTGEFKTAEEMLAERWRLAIGDIDLESLVQIGKGMKKKFSDLKEILATLDVMFDSPSSQAPLLLQLGEEFGLSDALKIKMMNRVGVESEGNLLKNIAPYAAYCLKVNMLFKLGVMNNLIGTRSTNKIDLEYLYYLPFCYIFTSNDNFHNLLAPLLLRSYQVYSSGGDLKDDLRALAEWKGQAGGNTSKSSGPPDIEGSLTVFLWKKYMKYPSGESNRSSVPKASPRTADSKIIAESKYLAELADDPRSHYKGHFKEDEIDFMIVHRSVGPQEPCPCNSGKKFIDCHWDEVKKST